MCRAQTVNENQKTQNLSPCPRTKFIHSIAYSCLFSNEIQNGNAMLSLYTLCDFHLSYSDQRVKTSRKSYVRLVITNIHSGSCLSARLSTQLSVHQRTSVALQSPCGVGDYFTTRQTGFDK